MINLYSTTTKPRRTTIRDESRTESDLVSALAYEGMSVVWEIQLREMELNKQLIFDAWDF